MKSIKLTKHMRDMIVNGLLSRWEEKNLKEEAYENFGKILFQDLKDLVLTKEVLDNMKDVPEEYFPKTSTIQVWLSNSNYERYHILINGSYDYGSTNKLAEIRIPYHLCDGVYLRINSDKLTPEIIDRIREHQHRVSKYNEQKKEVKRIAAAAISKFNTTKQIVDNWPEAVPFLPEDIAEESTAIAICREDLNKKFDLPVEEPIAA